MSNSLFQVIILTTDLINGRLDRARVVPAGPILMIYSVLFGPASLEEAEAYLAGLADTGSKPMSGNGGDFDYWPWSTHTTLSRTSGGMTVGTAKGVDYRIVLEGRDTVLIAHGTTMNSNDKVYLSQLAIAIYPPQFHLVVETPAITLPAVREFTVEAHLFGLESWVTALTVWDGDGKHVIRIPQTLPTT
jgi:hypothetical protein